MPDKPSKLRASVISGVVIGFVWAIPGLNLINCCCCAGVILGGVLAMYLYQQEFTEEMQPVESSDAVILGIIAGVIAAFTSTILNLVIIVLFGDIATQFARLLLDKMIERLNQGGGLPPESIDQLREQFERSVGESRTVTGVLADLIVNLIINPLFAMLGALIGYSLFRRKKKIDNNPQVQA
jgi:hypothetical protein